MRQTLGRIESKGRLGVSPLAFCPARGRALMARPAPSACSKVLAVCLICLACIIVTVLVLRVFAGIARLKVSAALCCDEQPPAPPCPAQLGPSHCQCAATVEKPSLVLLVTFLLSAPLLLAPCQVFIPEHRWGPMSHLPLAQESMRAMLAQLTDAVRCACCKLCLQHARGYADCSCIPFAGTLHSAACASNLTKIKTSAGRRSGDQPLQRPPRRPCGLPLALLLLCQRLLHQAQGNASRKPSSDGNSVRNECIVVAGACDVTGRQASPPCFLSSPRCSPPCLAPSAERPVLPPGQQLVPRPHRALRGPEPPHAGDAGPNRQSAGRRVTS